MPLAFPPSPSINDPYSFAERAWVFNGEGWDPVSGDAPDPAKAKLVVEVSWRYLGVESTLTSMPVTEVTYV